MAAPASAGVPPALKPINKFILKAKSLEKLEPVVSYHCRMYALETAMQLKSKEPAAKGFMLGLMEALEKQKKSLPALSKEDAKLRCETFALNVFAEADNEDRAGNATKKTAFTFQAATVFFEICKQFGELSSDIQEKLRYAQWKAVDISKAIKEGRTPVPGGMGDEMDELGLQAGGASANAGGFSESDFGGPPSSSSQNFAPNPAPAPAPQHYAPPPQNQSQYSPPPQNQNQYSPPPPPQNQYSPAPQNQYSPLPSSSGAYPSPREVPSSGYPPSSFASGQMGGMSFGDSSPPPSSAPAPAPAPSHPPAAAHRPSPAPAPQHYSNHPPQSHAPSHASSHAPAPAPAQQFARMGNSFVINPKPGMDKVNALLEAEKLSKHAQSAVRFNDVPTAIAKLSEAIALLLPHNPHPQ